MENKITNSKQLEPEAEPQAQLQLQPQPQTLQHIYNNRLPDPDYYYGPSGCIQLDANSGYVAGTIRIGKKLEHTKINMNQEYYVKCKIFGEQRADLVVKFINHHVSLVIAYRQRRFSSKDKHNDWYQVPPDYYWFKSWYNNTYIDIYQTQLCFHIEDILMC